MSSRLIQFRGQATRNVCALCHQPRILRDSHIIPEFFFRLVYDKKPRRFHIISSDPSLRDGYGQQGLYEKLLCDECEQRFNRWELYTKDSFVDGRGVEIAEIGNSMVMRGLDYKRFKLFQMSLLWRMGVSSLPFFQEVELGIHEERLRHALLNDDPLRPDQYACALIAVEIDGKPRPDWIGEPSAARYDSYRVYWLVINSVLYMFHVGSHAPPAGFEPLFISPRNEILIPVRDVHELPFLADIVLRIGKARHERQNQVPAANNKT